ncbi:MAG: helix-turn-helix domain-containing protein [Phenylobacterium sp.]|uniref:helix-turn-helix domain-containing protein n=1 Tax=Phenylobacterium sp. TaxID=1871053 RepID=UPI0025F75374|nr:helix-turn-helix transcriptional regulator [Phenylobacterium sp.]MCG9915435.1 helix-turn-helix domain-containing protein [Phenylobacterium sp.]
MEWGRIVGANVRRLRKARGLTQEQLAHDAGIDLTYVGGIERGRRNPSLAVLVRLAESLGVHPPALFDVDTNAP